MVFLSDASIRTPKVCFPQKCFSVEVVSQQADLQKGLMFREYLNQAKGMLFIFPQKGMYDFWMKNTLIPLDIIWLDESGKIVSITSYALPCREHPCPSYHPQEPAQYVLEINGGLCEKFHIRVGEKAKIFF